jgi:hypothetical protein
LLLAAGPARAADTIVQVPLTGLLDGRTVSTFIGGKIAPWTDGSGIDHGGADDGYQTQAVSKFLNQNTKALPDDGTFPANARHPEVVLHFSNAAASTDLQTHPMKGAATFAFPVPSATYRKLFLFVTSAEGSSAVTVTMTYADATTDTRVITLPDYFNNVDTTEIFMLATDLGKWKRDGSVVEANHHNLDGLELNPAPAKTLTSVKISKTAGGYMVFWGATGIATSAVVIPDGGAAGMGGGNGDGGAGTSGGAGTGGGAAGTSGAAGTNGAAGMNGAAGTNAAAGTNGAAGVGAAGVSGAAGIGAAGVTGTAGATGTAGTSGAAGVSGAAGSTGTAGMSHPMSPPGATDGGGCSCRASSGDAPMGSFALMGLLALFVFTSPRRAGRARRPKAGG